MERYRMPRAMALALTSVLLVSSGAAAQSDEEPASTPPPDFLPYGRNLVSAVLIGNLEDPREAEAVVQAVLAAHDEHGGNTRLCDGAQISSRCVISERFDRPADVGARLEDLTSREAGAVPQVAVVFGGDGQATVGEARLNGSTVFLDIDQPVPCVTESGVPDPSGTCTGGADGLPFNYSAVTFAVDEAAYLAGIVAASASRTGRLGVISGMPTCDECHRTIEGFTLGARSVSPSIQVDVAFLSDADEEAAYGDLAMARSFAEAFINVYQPEVLLPIAGASSRGIIEAACEAGILVVGTGTDVSVTYPNLAGCVLTSVVKDYDQAVKDTMLSFQDTVLPQRVMDLANGGVDLRAGDGDWTQQPNLRGDLTARVQSAREAIAAGIVDTCPTLCPSDDPPDGEGEGDGDGSDDDGADDGEAPEETGETTSDDIQD